MVTMLFCSSHQMTQGFGNEFPPFRHCSATIEWIASNPSVLGTDEMQSSQYPAVHMAAAIPGRANRLRQEAQF